MSAIKNLLIILLFSTSIILSSCDTRNSQLLIQNNTQEDSLLVTVSVNGDQLVNKFIKRAFTSFSYEESFFKTHNDSIEVEVEIPQIGLKKTALSKNENIRQVIITIRSVPISNIPEKEGVLSTIPKKKEILIAFFGKRSHKNKAL